MEFAVARALERTGSVVIVLVIPWSPSSFNTPTENEHRHTQKEAEIAAATEQVIDPLAGLVREAGVPLEVVVTHGDPVHTIITIAEERHSDHIVLGRTGDSRVRQTIFDGTPGHLARIHVRREALTI